MRDTTMSWQRSSFCASTGCVEIARIDGTVMLRDSKNPGQSPVSFTPAEWRGFQERVLEIGKST
jgi:hypothetical protein